MLIDYMGCATVPDRSGNGANNDTRSENYSRGQIINLPEQKARELIESGAAEEVPMRIRLKFRRTDSRTRELRHVR